MHRSLDMFKRVFTSVRPVTRFQQSGFLHLHHCKDSENSCGHSAVLGVKPAEAGSSQQPAARPRRHLFLLADGNRRPLFLGDRAHVSCCAGGKTSAVAPKQVKTKEHVVPSRPTPGPASPQDGHQAPHGQGDQFPRNTAWAEGRTTCRQ